MFIYQAEGWTKNGESPDELIISQERCLTHSRRDLLNVLNFEYLQLGYILGIMSVE